MGAGLFADAGISAVGAGAALVFLGVAVLGPILARPLTRLIGSPLPRLAGVPGTLARENAMRNPKRTSTTAAALMIGVALVGFITVLASSTKASIDDAVGTAFTGDYVIDSGSMGTGGFNPQLTAALNDLPEVQVASPIRMTSVRIDGSALEIFGADPATIGDVFDFGDVTGALDQLGPTQIAVLADEATDRGLQIGDPVQVEFGETGVQTFTVGATYTEDAFAGTYFVSLDAFEANVADQFDTMVFVATDDGVSADQARGAITAATDDYPQADVQDRDEFAGAQAAQIDQMLNLVYALLALAVLIALIGIANTLALSIFERTRELGLLRAVGMTRGQVRATVRWEAVIVALLGTGLGLAIGLGFGWAVVEALGSEGITVFVVPGTQLAIITVLAALAGIAAALLPARRAARLDVLRAISTT
jgi:putative ABC transport system permease protein